MKEVRIFDRNKKTLFITHVTPEDPHPMAAALAQARRERVSLEHADLERADLDDVRLRNAYLAGVDLSSADLARADLEHVHLSRATLIDASLPGAHLAHADLCGADLSECNLQGADLSNANLIGANLSKANLRGTLLTGANLGDAKLDGCNLDEANLEEIFRDLCDVLDHAPNEVDGLRNKLRAGEIDGMCRNPRGRWGVTRPCLIGTIAALRGCPYEQLGDLKPNAFRPAERWFLALRPGEDPEVDQIAAITDRWITAWMVARVWRASRRGAFQDCDVTSMAKAALPLVSGLI